MGQNRFILEKAQQLHQREHLCQSQSEIAKPVRDFVSLDFCELHPSLCFQSFALTTNLM